MYYVQSAIKRLQRFQYFLFDGFQNATYLPSNWFLFMLSISLIGCIPKFIEKVFQSFSCRLYIRCYLLFFIAPLISLLLTYHIY